VVNQLDKYIQDVQNPKEMFVLMTDVVRLNVSSGLNTFEAFEIM